MALLDISPDRRADGGDTVALTSEREKRICAKYSSASKNDGLVHCNECPLNYLNYGVDMPPMTCKAIMHYDRHKRIWVDDVSEEGDRDE